MKKTYLGLAVGAAVVATLAGAAALTADAQGRGGPGGGPPHFMRGRGGPGMFGIPFGRLNLSDTQRTQVRAVVEEGRAGQGALHEKAAAARQALHAAVTADSIDEAVIRARSADVAAVEADLAVAHAGVWSRVMPLLTPEQRAQAKEFQQQATRPPGRPHGPPRR